MFKTDILYLFSFYYFSQDIHELEVFVNLCASDTGAEFGTVLKFHHAATGYAPFIWDLHRESSLRCFFEVLGKISEANSNDDNLLLQWVRFILTKLYFVILESLNRQLQIVKANEMLECHVYSCDLCPYALFWLYLIF